MNHNLELVLLFKLEDHLFCIDQSTVKKAIYFTEIQFVPGMPDYFMGLLNFHGTNIAIIDLTLRLGIKRTHAHTVNTPIILCYDESHQIGLVVDEIIGIEDSSTSKIQIQKLFKGDVAEYVQGTINTEEGSALLLRLQRIFDNQEAV